MKAFRTLFALSVPLLLSLPHANAEKLQGKISGGLPLGSYLSANSDEDTSEDTEITASVSDISEPEGPHVEKVNVTVPRNDPAPPAPAPENQPAIDKGDFILSFEETSDRKAQKIAAALSKSPMVKEVVDGLTEGFSLPRDLEITFKDCDDANAYYDSEHKSITVCYQLVTYAYSKFRLDEDVSKSEAMQSAEHAGIFFLLHEVGHAVIDLYDLSILGREEDAADYVAQILAGRLDNGEKIIVDTALQFAAFADDEDEAGHDFADEHSPSAVRAFNLLCQLYGKDPERFAEMVGDDGLPESRAQGCPDEYQAIKKAGERLLAKWMKT